MKKMNGISKDKLIFAAIKLLHKRERQSFEEICSAFSGTYVPPTYKYDYHCVWFWGLKRWKKRWPELEYKIRSNKG